MGTQASSSPPQVSDEIIARRKEVFKLFDNANVSSSHIRICLVASAGFFTDGYSLYTLNFVFPMLVYAYGSKLNESLAMIICAAWFGSLLGHLLFGYMADKYGRKKMFGVELIIVIIGTVFSAIAGQGPTLSFVSSFVFCRFILGIGVGGDYPISALIISELAPTKSRGTMLAAGFAIFSLGILSAGFVSIIALVAFRASIHQDSHSLDHVWRLTIGLGAVPAIIALHFRLSIPETPRYLIDIEREIYWTRNIDVSQIGDYEYQRRPRSMQNTAHLSDMYKYFCSEKNGQYLILTSFIWFFANINLFIYPSHSPVIINKDSYLVYKHLLELNLNYVLWLFLGYIPGVLLSMYLIDRWGRKPILYIGFTACAALYIFFGVLNEFVYRERTSQTPLYYSVSTIYLFFLTFGLRAVAFVVPAKLFATRHRSIAYGISATFGKLDSILTYVVSGWLNSRHRIFIASVVCAIFMIIGAASTTLLPETKNVPLEKTTDDKESNAKQ